MITTILHMVSAFMVTSVILHYHAKQGLPVYTYTEIWDSLSKFINFCIFPEVKVLVVQSCMTSFNTMDCSPPGSSVHGILQAWILEWLAILFSQGVFLTQGPVSPALQADSLPFEPLGKPLSSLLTTKWY